MNDQPGEILAQAPGARHRYPYKTVATKMAGGVPFLDFPTIFLPEEMAGTWVKRQEPGRCFEADERTTTMRFYGSLRGLMNPYEPSWSMD